MPTQLFDDVVENRYRNDRFLRGTLAIDEKQVDVEQLRAPTIGVVNLAGGVAPPE